MANYPNKYKSKSATGRSKPKFDLSFQHITTNDFGIIKPLALKYCVPGDHHIIDVNEFTRLMPMPSPTFGKIDTVTRAYFVPMRTVFPTFLEYVSMNPSPFNGAQNTVTSVPYCTVGDLVNVFRQTGDNGFSYVSSSVQRCDFYLNGSKYLLTTRGRRVRDYLLAMGLNFSLSSPNTFGDYQNQKISLLPVFAYLRTYLDWIVPARYLTGYRKLLGIIRSFNDPTRTQRLTTSELTSLLIETRQFLEDDFFTSAWEMPFNNGGSQSNVTVNFRNPQNVFDDYDYDDVLNVSASTKLFPASTNDDNEAGHTIDSKFNAYTLQTLGCLQDLLNRGILAGTKVEDWLYTEFGMKPNNAILDTSLYLGSHTGVVQIGDVMSTADTGDTGALLGQFAGRGLTGANGHYDFTCKEHGYLIITSCVLPRTSYYQGIHPEFYQFDRFDFFQPEFDNLAGEAIPYKLLCNDVPVGYTPNEQATAQQDPNQIFGFCPRYASLKTSFDSISGDFRVPSVSQGLNSWFLARDFSNINSQQSAPFRHISLNFCDASEGTETNSYDRIFSYAGNDHFYQIVVFKWIAYRPMKSVSEFLEPQHEDNGKDITVTPNH